MEAKTGDKHQVTSGYFNDDLPTFDPEGKYLFFTSDRTFDPVYGRFDNSWTYANATNIVAVPLKKDQASPMAPRNDAENDKKADADKKDGKDERRKTSRRRTTQEGREAGVESHIARRDRSRPRRARRQGSPSPPPHVTIDYDGFESRGRRAAAQGGQLRRALCREREARCIRGVLAPARPPRKSPVLFYDFDEREEKTILDDADGFEPTADGKKIFAVQKRKFAVVEVKADQKFEKPMRTAEMEAPVDPRAEWRQIFNDTWRFERDYFYDPGMHGVDWAAMRTPVRPPHRRCGRRGGT